MRRASGPIVTAVVIAVWLLVPSSADAQIWRNASAAGALKIDAQYSHLEDDSMSTGLSDTVLAGFGFRGIGAKAAFGLAVAFDARVGGGAQGGFAYEFALSPLGIGLQVGRFATAAVTIGVGVSQVTGHIPAAATFPLEARIEIDLGRHVHLDTWGRTQWTAASSRRKGGAENAPFGDELLTGASLRFGRGGKDHWSYWGNGIFIGVTYGERLHTRDLGAILGYSINTDFRESSGGY